MERESERDREMCVWITCVCAALAMKLWV